MPSAFHVLIERVQIDVSDQRADHASLGAAPFDGLALVPEHNPALQELLEQRQYAAVGDLTTKLAQNEIVIQCVKTPG